MNPKFLNSIIAAAATAALTSAAWSAVTADEAKPLGTSLTWWGAEVAGNKDGSIPAYTGGLKNPPPVKTDAKGYVTYPDPFASEKPVVRITAANMAHYADKLTEGAKTLLKKNADYYIDVYPTQRTTTYPDAIKAATLRNATQCKTTRNGVALEQSCRGGIPFPVPKTGFEVMWNKLIPYHNAEYHSSQGWTVDTTGRPVMASQIRTYADMTYFREVNDKNRFQVLAATYEAPPRLAGSMNGTQDFLDPDAHPRLSYAYTPGQRRVRLAPEFSYDTPLATAGGAQFYDDIYLFFGKMDRFDFKLIGKKEMYIPANSYKLYLSKAEQLLKPKFLNPELDRWELRRVWVVEATLKPGERHAYSKRVYYFDEDNQTLGMVDTYDQGKSLYRTGFMYGIQMWDQGYTYGTTYAIYDFIKNMYSIGSYQGGEGFKWVDAQPERDLTPDAIVAKAIR
jgi:hypothetical protein